MLGSLAANATAYYRFVALNMSYIPTALFSVSATTGFPSLYVSLNNSVPSAASFDYATSTATGGVVDVMQPTPYTVFLTVQASPYSSSNYTLVAMSYDPSAAQPTPIALPDAEPLASLIAAGEYRYYTYVVPYNTSQVTVSLTETYGQSYLLIDPPGITGLPTLASNSYASTDATFPLVVLTAPVEGVWTIGVWSNASSVFSIIAVTGLDTTPMQLGVTYPGSAPEGTYTYYSFSLDELLLATSTALRIELYSINGLADLYCSDRTERPTINNPRWSSRYNDLEYIVIPTIQLSNNSVISCGVIGYVYLGHEPLAWAITASYGTAIAFTPGETIIAEGLAGDTQTYQITFPATLKYITLSIVSDVGSTALTITRFTTSPGNPIQTFTAAQLQFFQSGLLSFCGYNNAWAIPGSNPPLCQMIVTVTTPVTSVYRITASTDGQIVALVAGEPVDWAVTNGQPAAYFFFFVPDNLSTATLIVTVNNGSSGLLLVAGREYAGGSWTPTWNATQQPGSNLLVFQLDYTMPDFRQLLLRGSYIVRISSLSAASFSILYTVANASATSSSVTRLVDSSPQESVLNAGAYNFFKFIPSADGWPYAVTFSISWVSGSGYLRYELSDYVVAGPVAGAYMVKSLYDTGAVSTNGLTGSCTPGDDTTCGFSISVQADLGLQQPAVYVITAFSGHYVRQLTSGDPATPRELLQPTSVDYWTTPVDIVFPNAITQLIYGVSVLSGTVSAYASNTTSTPNATNAQYSQMNLTASSVLAIPIMSRSFNDVQYWYLTVQCTSTDGTACQYEVLSYLYVNRQGVLATGNVNNRPVRSLIPAGVISFTTYQVDTDRYTAVASFTMQAAVLAGAASLYAGCLPNLYAQSSLPNETTSTWSVLTAPLAIELTNFTFPADCRYLALGVRASSAAPAWVETSIAFAGVVQRLPQGLYGIVGLSTPAYPTSYYSYAVSSDQWVSFALSLGPRGCSLFQLQMVVSTTNEFPDPSSPATYDYSRTGVQLANGAVDLSILYDSFTRPAAGINTTLYYLAVTTVNTSMTCDYNVVGFLTSPRPLVIPGMTTLHASSYVNYANNHAGFMPMPVNTAVSIAMQLGGRTGSMVVFAGVSTSPSPGDPSSYLINAFYDTSDTTAFQPYNGDIYVPASACTASIAVKGVCTVVVRTFSMANLIAANAQSMSAVSATTLYEHNISTVANTSTVANSSVLFNTYLFSLPAEPLSVTVSVNTTNTTAAVTIACSYRYVTPDDTFYDWNTKFVAVSNASVNATGSATTGATSNRNTTALTFGWDASLQTNANTSFAANATVCYCSVTATTADSYNITYATVSLVKPSPPSAPSSPSSSGGLSREALGAAIVVPVLAVLIVIAVLGWLYRSGRVCFAGKGRSSSDGRSHQRMDESNARELSMAELSTASRAVGAGLWNNRGKFSDEAGVVSHT